MSDVAFPKPDRLSERAKAKRERFLKGREFRRVVWARDQGLCQYCHVRVKKTLELHPDRGEVHHKRGRNVAPEDKYNPDTAVLLCLACHMKAQRHEIDIP